MTTTRKFFDSKDRETTPDKAAYMVEIITDAKGKLVETKFYVKSRQEEV